MLLYINACCGSQSRTDRIARAFLNTRGSYTELHLETEYIEPLDGDSLANRNAHIARGDFSHSYFDYARQFASADEIVIAAPFWDLSFPAKLKTYLENITITGLTFRYSPEGMPIGMCKAKKLTYITTSGGPYVPDYGFGYIKAVAMGFYGIADVQLIYAEMLDVAGFDPEKILGDCIAEIEKSAGNLLSMDTVRLPNVIGKPYAEARAMCVDKGLTVTVSDPLDRLGQSIVAMSNPAPGIVIPRGSTVCLILAEE